ncbi:MAG: hypothetical protein EU535_07760 [Promethearchaeota archaeon]|nr:MAG: hypothetical protein EU535_07760 [Candidatus Lokiarchaeota archaeon]
MELIFNQTNFKLKRLPSWDQFECKECGHKSNRHTNAARVSVLLLKSQVQAQNAFINYEFRPSPLSTGWQGKLVQVYG